MKIISRKEAALAGLPRYFTGKPCKYGHTAPRRVPGGACSKCDAINQAKWRAANLDLARARDRAASRKKLPVPTRPEPRGCELCGEPPGKKSLNIDHCHATHAFRGWLCSGCNTALGRLGDNLDGLRRAQAYLERSHAPHS